MNAVKDIIESQQQIVFAEPKQRTQTELAQKSPLQIACPQARPPAPVESFRAPGFPVALARRRRAGKNQGSTCLYCNDASV
jgi:hypothetical protein